MQKSRIDLTNRGITIFLITGILPIIIGVTLSNIYDEFRLNILIVSCLLSGMIFGIMIGIIFKGENPEFGNRLFKLKTTDNNPTTVSTK